MATPEPTYTLTGTNLGETAKALRFSYHSIKENATGRIVISLEEDKVDWFPLSQITQISKGIDLEADAITVKRWLLVQKGVLG